MSPMVRNIVAILLAPVIPALLYCQFISGSLIAFGGILAYSYLAMVLIGLPIHRVLRHGTTLSGIAMYGISGFVIATLMSLATWIAMATWQNGMELWPSI